MPGMCVCVCEAPVLIINFIIMICFLLLMFILYQLFIYFLSTVFCVFAWMRCGTLPVVLRANVSIPFLHFCRSCTVIVQCTVQQ